MCDCIATANKGLVEHGAELDLATMFHPVTHHVRRDIQIKTKRLGPRKRGGLPIMVATYCPFCGEEIKR
jgi:hypothetical protein